MILKRIHLSDNVAKIYLVLTVFCVIYAFIITINAYARIF